MASPSKHGATSLELCDLTKSSDGPPDLGPRPSEAFLSEKRVAGITTAQKWLDNWLGTKCGPYWFKPNVNYASSLEKLSDTSVEQDNVIRFLEEYGVWLGGNSLPSLSKKDCSLEASTKFTYFKATKQVLLCRFPDHPVLKPSDDG